MSSITFPKIVAFGVFAASNVANAGLTVQNYWDLDETTLGTNVTLVDSVGGKNIDGGHGFANISSSTTTVAPGSSFSLHFAGVSGKYSSTPSLQPSLPADNYIIEFWANPDNASAVQQSLFLQNGGAQMQIHNGQWAIGMNGAYWGDTGVAVQAGQWTHLAFVRNEGKNEAYINGVKYLYDGMSADRTNATSAEVNQLLLGCGSGGGASYTGYLDDVRYSFFDQGTFSTSYLLINQIPEPTSFSFLGFAGLSLLTRRKRK